MKIGRELLHELGIYLQFSTTNMKWKDVEEIMKESTCTKEETFHVEEELFVSEETNQIAKISDAKYAPDDLEDIVENLHRLDKEQKRKTIKVVSKP